MDYPNWFEISAAQNNFGFFLDGMKGAPVKVLQVGAFTGDASAWLFRRVLYNTNATLVDVDTWTGSEEDVHKSFDWSEIEAIYDSKVANHWNQLDKYKMTSEEFFEKNNETFDFIYVDGSHTALDVFNDGISAFECLNEGGILAFDDYTWDDGKGDFLNPRDGIDGVYLTYEDQVTILHAGSQVWLQKTSKPKMLIEGV